MQILLWAQYELAVKGLNKYILNIQYNNPTINFLSILLDKTRHVLQNWMSDISSQSRPLSSDTAAVRLGLFTKWPSILLIAKLDCIKTQLLVIPYV